MGERAAGRLELRMLGPVEAVCDGAVVDLGPRRQRTVLVRLALSLGRPVPIDRLIDDVWGGRPPEGAVRTLRSYLSRLRGALGGEAVIVPRAGGYLLALEPQAVDATRFERLAGEGRTLLERRNARAAAGRLRAALEEWRGEALAGLPPEPFVTAEVARLEDRRLAAIEDRVEADLALGRHADLIAELEALVSEHSLRERLWAGLMTALYRAGRQADALAAYRRARTILVEQLGLEPGDELRALESAILRHELPAPERDVPHNLPAPLTTFVGRERELRDLTACIARERLVTVVGTGGAGKTRLAVEAARNLLERFADGTWLVDLAPVAEPAHVAPTVATVVGAPLGGSRPEAGALADHLARADSLLVLDNCEHLVEAAALLVERLLAACPQLRVLATSRESLGIPGEAVFELPPLPAPPAGAQEGVERYDAVRLFLDRAAGRGGEEAIEAVARVCRDLDGLPLAIEIAAAQTRVLGPPEIAEHLADRFRFLTYWSRTAPARHRTLRASLDWSDALLQPQERALFHRLSVFAGSFTVAAAQAVADGEAAALDHLRRLVDASLVAREGTPGAARLRLLETVRQYAADRLRATGGVEEAAARHAAFYAAVCDRAARAAGTPEEPAVYAGLDLDVANVRAALEFAFATGDAALLGRLVRGMGRFWRLRGFLDESELWLRRVLEVSGDAALHAEARGLLGQVLITRGDHRAATAELSCAVELARRSGTDRQLGELLHWLAMAARMAGRLPDAVRTLAEALDRARAGGDVAATSHRLGALADVATLEGRFDDAQALYDEAWAVVQPAPHGHRVPYFESTARLAVIRGDLPEAERRAGEGLAAARELGDGLHVALTTTILSVVARRTGRDDRALELLAEALDALWPRYGWGVADVLDVLGTLLCDRGEPAAGVVLMAAAAAELRRTPGPVVPLATASAEADRRAARAALGPDGFDRAWRRGADMALADAVAAAQRTLGRPVPPDRGAPAVGAGPRSGPAA